MFQTRRPQILSFSFKSEALFLICLTIFDLPSQWTKLPPNFVPIYLPTPVRVTIIGIWPCHVPDCNTISCLFFSAHISYVHI